MRFIIVNAIHWFVPAFTIYKDHGLRPHPCVPATDIPTGTFINCDVCASTDQAFGCCTKAVAPFTRRTVCSVEMHEKRRALNLDAISKSTPFAWRTIRHFWIHLRRFALGSERCMRESVGSVNRRHSEAANWHIGYSNRCDRHRPANKRNSSFVAAISERIDRSIISSVHDDTIQVSFECLSHEDRSYCFLSFD